MKKLIKPIMGFVAAAIIGAGGYFANEYTVPQAIDIATNPAKASKACESLLKGEGFVVWQPKIEDVE